MNVAEFTGSMTDGRSKFLQWTEKMRDRVLLYDANLADVMKSVENRTEAISKDDSENLGVAAKASAELQGFSKDRYPRHRCQSHSK